MAFLPILAAVLSPFFVNCSSEVRTTYISLGGMVEDRPMWLNWFRPGVDAGRFGRFAFHHWNVSSMTDRRAQAHRHMFYHTEFGPAWDHAWEFVDGWKLKSNVLWAWTLYRGFYDPLSDGTYQWIHLDESVENRFVVPFCSFRRCYVQADYFYFKFGLRRGCPVGFGLVLTPSVFFEGGNGNNFRRCFGASAPNESWGAGGVSSVTSRLELSRSFGSWCSAFLFVEQYDVLGGQARDTNAKRTFVCAHNDWFSGGLGLRLFF